MSTKTEDPKIIKVNEQIIRQARKIVVMRRKQALWKDLEPQLSKLGTLVKSLENLEKKDGE